MDYSPCLLNLLSKFKSLQKSLQLALTYQIEKSTKKFAIGFLNLNSKIYEKVCHWLQLSKFKNLQKSLLMVLTYQIEKSTKKFAIGFNLGNSKIYQKVCQLKILITRFYSIKVTVSLL